ncbi:MULTISPECIES: cysteine desulfurase CsdA [Lonsdalea]|uniref:Cysteine sulfinate desulfinase n=2 Tax=Lonsdalea TaxID=1082702 RepID=A0ACD1J8Y8_9GAMM|nr:MULTISPECIES: cysteine desulfurase CsdA [Lonsdalea]OSM98124.1 cysteine sulfinate desulfinase [Lonsdalea populi]OSN00035.1 cysteine sulfinate desulfinase [Lonsdalea populi]QPQ25025.1 cysteine desulfurase CsdA [Lonsdalea populi]RAT11055.1 cysteine sulfinate desulfinase [Lonsdalea quercina]RAT13889.1 cysteine sulfinate desulfinase [Lonsdalea quercina]
MISFNAPHFRQQFPALQQPGVYLDSAATALKPQSMIDAIGRYYGLQGGNVHRSQHREAQRLTQCFEETRRQVAALIGAPDPHSVIWTRGATESINLVAQSFARPLLTPGDEIVVSEAEHHANLLPWLMVARQTGANVVKWPLGDDLLPDVGCLPALLSSRTRILALTQMSNVTGGQPNLQRAIALAHQADAVVVVDGAQGIVHKSVDVRALDIDFYAFSAHKLYGPTGIGILYGKPELLAGMPPWQGGGKMMQEVSFDGFIPQDSPQKFEAGTPHIAGVIGLSATLEWLKSYDRHAAEQYSVALAEQAEKALMTLPGFRSWRSADSSLLSFTFNDVHHSDLVPLLAEEGIALRAGHHCAQPLMTALGVKGTLRASFSPYNNEQDVAQLIAASRKALDLLLD